MADSTKAEIQKSIDEISRFKDIPWAADIVTLIKSAGESVDSGNITTAQESMGKAFIIIAKNALTSPITKQANYAFGGYTMRANNALINASRDKDKNTSPQESVKKTENGFVLVCDKCGFPAAGTAKLPNNKWQYVGSVWMGETDTDLEPLLSENNLKEAHKKFEQGMDCYCPDCDKNYCSIHYNVRYFMNYGTNEGNEGTCPKGHKRVLFIVFHTMDSD